MGAIESVEGTVLVKKCLSVSHTTFDMTPVQYLCWFMHMTGVTFVEVISKTSVLVTVPVTKWADTCWLLPPTSGRRIMGHPYVNTNTGTAIFPYSSRIGFFIIFFKRTIWSVRYIISVQKAVSCNTVIQCCGTENISFASGSTEPQIRITALAPVPALENYLFWLSNRIRILTIYKKFFSNHDLFL